MNQNPQDDADRIRLKRLAKLQNNIATASHSNDSNATSNAKSSPQQTKPAPAPKPVSNQKRPIEIPPAPASPVPKKRPALVAQQLDLNIWEHNTIGQILMVTLDRSVAEQSDYDIVWLKNLASEFYSDGLGPPASIRLTQDIVDPLLIARLHLDPLNNGSDLEYLPFLVSLPEQQTTFEFLLGCWKRLNAAKAALFKKSHGQAEMQRANKILEKIRHLLISYTGLTLQDPDMFPQPGGRDLGPPELVNSLVSHSAFSDPLLSTSSNSSLTLAPSEVEIFLQDLARRFEPDNEIDGILGPVARLLFFHEALLKPEGLIDVDSRWRRVASAIEAFVSVKSIAAMVTRMNEWLPPTTSGAVFEKASLMGPLCRLGIFGGDWPSILQSYFSDPEKLTRDNVESSILSLRGTLSTLQTSISRIFGFIIRASSDSKEAVLQYFARAVFLNVKRCALQRDPETIGTDSFMMNVHHVIIRFTEPFLDSQYTKIDRVDPLYFAHSNRLDLKEETRIKATSDEATEWAKQNATSVNAPHFISEIFFLALAITHVGCLPTVKVLDEIDRRIEDAQRYLEMLQGDGSWMTSPHRAHTETAINNVKTEKSKLYQQQLSYRAHLLHPSLVMSTMSFLSFASTWIIRRVDPNKKHPSPQITLPLPKDVPMAFRTLPEYILEDIIDYPLFVIRNNPDSFDLQGKIELLTFALAFLSSTWYIKNPFLKAKINEALFVGILPWSRDRHGVLEAVLNEHPLALQHLIPALTNFYIEVEQTGASSQFYDKFNARRNIAYILKAVWNSHRAALRKEAENVDKFVRFVNLMINDVTYLMDESLSELAQIHNLQREMEDTTTWQVQPTQYRREREMTLRQLERHASGYTTLGRSTVELLRDFTAETKAPFMMPEIVNRLAAMLDYNLDALVGPKCSDLKVKNPEKYKFDPKKLLSDILQVYLNLSDQPEFVRAVAGDGRSYRKELFDKAGEVALKKVLKSETDLEKLNAFIELVEEAKLMLAAEDEDLGEVPEEFLDPVMYTLMRDPVLLPSSKKIVDRATIKSHLLSDAKDPFNRAPLTIEEVIPDIELKAKIEAFLVERTRKKASHTHIAPGDSALKLLSTPHSTS